MPETWFHIRWPDGSEERCYSPSLVIKDFLVAGRSYAISEFVDRSQQALSLASKRVQAKYGFSCRMAQSQLARIEDASQAFVNDSNGRVFIKTFES